MPLMVGDFHPLVVSATGPLSKPLSWSIEGANGGTIAPSPGDSNGLSMLYGAPQKPGTYHLTAALNGQPMVTATILVVPGKFVDGGHLAVVRRDYAASVLAGGKVLITGGTSAEDETLASAEIYDPSTKTSRVIGEMNEKRKEHRSVTLSTGKVFIYGGDDIIGRMGQLNRKYQAQTPDGLNGLVLAAKYDTAEVFDPQTVTFARVGRSIFRTHFAMAKLPDDRVVICGGFDMGDERLRSYSDISLYEPSTGSLSHVADMQFPRSDHQVLALLNGRALIIGGSNVTGDTPEAELFNPLTGNTSIVGKMDGHHRWLLTEDSTLLGGNLLLHLDGTEAAPIPISIGTPEPLARLKSGNVLYVGDKGAAGLLDPEAKSFRRTGGVPLGRRFDDALELPDGRVLVMDYSGTSLLIYEPPRGR